MIVTQTPFRVTLGGGGTDLPSYYEKHGGFIFAMALKKYMFVMVNPPTIDSKIRLHYTQSEVVDHISALKHELAREALRYHGIEEKMEISSMADLPAGTGVGSSSCYLVGLLMALHHYRRDFVSLRDLAEAACDIELNVLHKGIGKQDQYMAAFGGMTVLDIAKNGSVETRQVQLSEGSIGDLVANTHLYYTGFRRDALEILSEQNNAMLTAEKPARRNVEESLHKIKDLGYRILEAIQKEDFDAWGTMLHEHWVNKKKMSDKISLTKVDQIYEEARKKYNVLGGKIVGAGGGGFLMLYCHRSHKNLERYMESCGMPRLHYSVEPEGVKVVASLENNQSTLFHPQTRNRSVIKRSAVVG